VTAIALLASAVQCEYSLSQLHSTSTDASEELLKVNVYSGSREANIHHVSRTMPTPCCCCCPASLTIFPRIQVGP